MNKMSINLINQLNLLKISIKSVSKIKIIKFL